MITDPLKDTKRNHYTDFHETRYKSHDIRNYPVLELGLVISTVNMVVMPTFKV
jgi:hypothetical protein